MSDPTEKEISIPWPGKSAIMVTLTTPPEGITLSGFGLVLGPGAGGDEKTPLLTAVAKEVAKQGHYCARYRARVPNLGFRVSVCTRVMEYLFHPTSGLYPLKGCFHGGHSMGTRVAGTVASQIALKGSEPPAVAAAAAAAATTTATAPTKKRATRGKKATTKDSDSTTTVSSSDFPQDFITGLILYSYPLHTQDNTKALRDQILYNIPSTTPTLFVSGLNDSMCSTTLFEKVFADMKSSPREVIRIEGADHGLGFGNLLASQARKERLIESIVEWTVAFMDDSITEKKKKTTKDTGTAADVATKKTAVLEKNNGDEWTLSLSTDT